MVTAPLFIIFLIAVVVAIWKVGTSPAAIVLGALFGLSLASTTLGVPILDGIESAMSSAFEVAGSIEGGAR